MMINTSMIDKELIAEKLKKQAKEREADSFDTILNNGVSKDTPYYNTINIDKYC